VTIDKHKSVKTLVQLGVIFKSLAENEKWPNFNLGLSEEEYNDGLEAIKIAKHHNGWFIEDNVKQSLMAWASQLTSENLESWTSNYDFNTAEPHSKVGVICAGNIPLVGLHDVICAFICGYDVLVKLSTKDTLLMSMAVKYINLLSGENRINIIQGKLTGFDKVIATGSNNTSRYFEYYFKDVPAIIRKNRTSVAVLNGEENEEQLKALGADVFSYFGLGCRNVTKIYMPKKFDVNRLFKAFYEFKDIINHNKYANNYDYHRAVWLMNKVDLLENGFILLKEEKELVSPVGTLFYERYEDSQLIFEKLNTRKEEIQCIVAADKIPFGKAQNPALNDYADNVDTLSFLLEP